MSATTTTIINPEAWLTAIREMDTAPVTDQYPDAVTVASFAEAMNLSGTQAGKRLRTLVATGRAERLFKSIRTADGRVRRVSAYRLITKKGK